MSVYSHVKVIQRTILKSLLASMYAWYEETEIESERGRLNTALLQLATEYFWNSALCVFGGLIWFYRETLIFTGKTKHNVTLDMKLISLEETRGTELLLQ